MTGAEQRSSLPYEGKAPSFHTGKGLAPEEASSEESEDEFMEARGEVSPPSDPPSPWEEARDTWLEAYGREPGRELKWHEFWPSALPNFGSRGEELESSIAREWINRKGLRLLQCDCHSEVISWRFPRKDYAWHPPRPLGCSWCLKKRL